MTPLQSLLHYHYHRKTMTRTQLIFLLNNSFVFVDFANLSINLWNAILYPNEVCMDFCCG